jgi:hypothetical protein
MVNQLHSAYVILAGILRKTNALAIVKMLGIRIEPSKLGPISNPN